METSRVECVYISAGCNRSPNSLDWGGAQNQLIYAHAHSVALLSAQEPFQIKCTFNKHKDKINSLKWVNRDQLSIQLGSNIPNEFVTASQDKTVIVWQGRDFTYEPIQVLEGHTNNVNVLDAMYNQTESDLSTYVASASVDSTINIWKRKSLNDSFNSVQKISCKMNGFALSLKFFLLPQSKLPMLLIGYENHKIELFVELGDNKFHLIHSLIGHEDWITDIDVCSIENDSGLMIATSSQDNYIRLWKMSSNLTNRKEDLLNVSKLIDEDSIETVAKIEEEESRVTQSSNEDDEEDQVGKESNDDELKLKSSLFAIKSKKLNKYVKYSLNLESVLYGHEDWIYTVKFHPKFPDGTQPMILMSASMDKTLVVWRYDEQNSIWIDAARAGDIGGNTLGFYGAKFDRTGQYIVAHGYQGALHLWKRSLDDQSERLVPAVINSGHFDLVEDLCWEPGQKYFLSTSKDQTTRFHGYWTNGERQTWHELGRPQIHGYDLKCVAFIDRFKFVSGADEKLLRIFEAPKIFLTNFNRLCLDPQIEELIEIKSSALPQGASVPALGLSNKAVFDEDENNNSNQEKKVSLVDELYKEVYFNKIDLVKPPTEEHLLQNTLWPEVQKLYGHGYEIFAVAVDTNSKVIASACKAAKADHADIILWQEQESNGQRLYKQACSIKGHDLTVVQMRFSNDGNYLISVSRDRSWKLYKRVSSTQQNEIAFELAQFIGTKNPYHTRIIWSCDWSHDDKYFVTTSRDKRACIWEKNQDAEKVCDESKPVKCLNCENLFLELNDSITACAFSPYLTEDNSYLIAFGLENGSIEFHTWNTIDGFRKYADVENKYTPHLTIKRLSFRKTFEKTSSAKLNKFCLAACSDDLSVRLYEIIA